MSAEKASLAEKYSKEIQRIILALEEKEQQLKKIEENRLIYPEAARREFLSKIEQLKLRKREIERESRMANAAEEVMSGNN